MNGNFTRRRAALLALALSVGLGGAAATARQPLPGELGAGHGPFLRALRGGLATVGLTEDQKSKIRTILESQRDAAQTLRQKMRTDAAALHAFAGAPDPDPAAVGAAYLKVRANRQQARQMAEEALGEIKSVLAPDQQAKLGGYLSALRQLRRHRFGGASG